MNVVTVIMLFLTGSLQFSATDLALSISLSKWLKFAKINKTVEEIKMIYLWAAATMARARAGPSPLYDNV